MASTPVAMTEIKALLLAGAGGRGPWAMGSELQRAEEAFANTLNGQSRGNFLAQREMRATRHELASHNMVLECCLEGVEVICISFRNKDTARLLYTKLCWVHCRTLLACRK